ncbi:lactonase family protein [Flavobacteriaceae bacterium]|nr:lactonase family protein [Flavobacteriaceae bacterium]
MLKYILFTLLILSNMQLSSQKLYVGTYTNTSSKGIYSLDFNPETGVLSNEELLVSSNNPSFISFGQDRSILYAVNEEEQGTISVFKRTSETGGYDLVQKLSTYGAHPCHVTYDQGYVAVSNYSGGNVAIYRVEESGILNQNPQVFDQNGENEKSHVHFAMFVEDQLIVSDLGRNTLFKYKKSEKGFELENNHWVAYEAKSGPRHFDFRDHQIYSITEYENTISLIDKSGDVLQKVSTLNKDFQGESYCADIHISPDGTYVYGSNRGDNSIGLFTRQPDGYLKFKDTFDVRGDWPRNFVIDPTGKWLLVGNQRSNNITVFAISTDGSLSFKHSYELGAPVCLIF